LSGAAAEAQCMAWFLEPITPSVVAIVALLLLLPIMVIEGLWRWWRVERHQDGTPPEPKRPPETD
jgi:hypothetical protein